MIQQVPDIPPIPDPVIITQTGSPPPWETMPPQVFAMIMLAIVAGSVLILWPLVRAIASRLEGGDRKLRAEVEDLRARLDATERQAIGSGEFEATDHRIYELEERVQFLERLLARTTKEDGR
jgi:hypothetical protein